MLELSLAVCLFVVCMGVKKNMTGQAVKGCDIRKYLIVRATQRAWQYDQVGKYGIS